MSNDLTPTPKSPAIDNLLTQLTGKSRADVISHGQCMTCNKPVNQFRDALSLQEYRISGMCQQCQDSVFGADDNDNDPIDL